MGDHVLYWGFNMGSAATQAIAACAGLPLTLWQVNFGHGEHRNPDYLAINPVGRVAALAFRTANTDRARRSCSICANWRQKAVPAAGDPARPGLWLVVFMVSDLYATMICIHYDDSKPTGSAPGPDPHQSPR